MLAELAFSPVKCLKKKRVSAWMVAPKCLQVEPVDRATMPSLTETTRRVRLAYGRTSHAQHGQAERCQGVGRGLMGGIEGVDGQ